MKFVGRIKYENENGAPGLRTLLSGAAACRPWLPLQDDVDEGAISRAEFGLPKRSAEKPGEAGYGENSESPSAASHEKDHAVSVGDKGGVLSERHAVEDVAPPSESVPLGHATQTVPLRYVFAAQTVDSAAAGPSSASAITAASASASAGAGAVRTSAASIIIASSARREHAERRGKVVRRK